MFLSLKGGLTLCFPVVGGFSREEGKFVKRTGS